MKHNLNTVIIIFCMFVLCFGLIGCNIPKIGEKQAPTETPAPVIDVPNTETEELLIQNNGALESDDGMMLQNNNGNTLPSVPENNDDEELPMITNPGRSAIEYPKTASLTFQSPSSLTGTNAQITRPTAVKNEDDGLVIVNDHTVKYPETQSIIQKSVPSGQLSPLGYIPPQSLANGQSIAFAPGATSAIISGYVPAGGYLSYNFYAFANQNFLVLLTSDSGTSVLSISDAYGNVFLDASQRQTSFSMYLPRTVTYYVNVHSQGYAENVTLQIFIPARVTIPQGQTSTVMSGTLAPYSVVSYTAYMYAGQTARIDDYSGSQPNSFLRVSGLQTGLVYMDYTAYSPSWYSVVPATQDYLIEVISMDQPSNYRLTIDVR